MSGMQTYVVDVVNQLLADHSVAMITSALLSPFKVIALIVGFYKSISPGGIKGQHLEAPTPDELDRFDM